MKPPVFRPLAARLPLRPLIAWLVFACLPLATLRSQEPSEPDPPTDSEAVKTARDIHIPLILNEPALGIKVPELGSVGQILSLLMATKAKRIDSEHVEMEGTKLNLNRADGKSDYQIEIPKCVFDEKSHVISSDQPVVIRTEEFELTGEKMRFNTTERSGELIGKVRMTIHNLKQTANAAKEQTTRPE